jgi:hypothetical protein
MPIYSICPSCNTGYDLADSLRGKRVVCKTCNDSFLVQETLRAPSASAPLGAAASGAPAGPPPLAEPVYGMAPPEPPPLYPDAVPPAASDYSYPPPGSEWDRLPRRRVRRREPQPQGLSGGAIAALILVPLAILLVLGVLLWVVLRPRDGSFDDDWVDVPPPPQQPVHRPGVVPIIIPAPRINNPGPRFNPPPVNPPRFNPPAPPRFNPPPPPRVRFR